jgi:hypothetical protein
MGSAITVLSIPVFQLEYAKKHGAKFDPVNEDWFIEGPVPSSLNEFLVGASRFRAGSQTPSCPNCGLSMTRIVIRKRNEQFWRCQKFPSCHGRLSLEQGAEQTLDTFENPINALQRSLNGTEVSADDWNRRYRDVVNAAEPCFKSRHQFERWMKTPKIALNGLAPNKALDTDQGCELVVALLRDLQSDSSAGDS